MARARSRTVARRLALVALTLAACGRGGTSEPPGLGRAVFSGPVRALHPSPDGAALAFLDGCVEAKAPFLPPQTARCDLRVVASAGGEAERVAAGVTTLGHGISWSPDGKALLALSDYDHASASGTLVLWRGGVVRRLADAVSFHGFGPAGEIGLVSAGRLLVSAPGGDPEPVEGGTEVATFEFVPRRRSARGGGGERPFEAVARKTLRAGGELVGIVGGRAYPVARSVGDYAFAPGGEEVAFVSQGAEARLATLRAALPLARPLQVGRGVRLFSWWPGGTGARPRQALAYVGAAAPGKQGDLAVRFEGRARPGERAPLRATEVGEFRWARGAPRLAWLERYDPRVRAGTLGAGGEDLRARTFAASVSEFDLSADGRHAAFLQHTTRGGYSVDLGVVRLDAPQDGEPVTVARGVFGFAFSPDGRWLYYRTRCVRNAEACDLERIAVGGSAPVGEPEVVAAGVKSFEFDPNEPGRLLLGRQRMDMVALDLAVWQDGKLVRVDDAALPGSARFLGPDSRGIAYAVAHPKRAGVYVAELPR